MVIGALMQIAAQTIASFEAGFKDLENQNNPKSSVTYVFRNPPCA